MLGPQNVFIFSDGSVEEGHRAGEAGVVVRRSDGTLQQCAVPAGARSSSYTSRLSAMLEAATAERCSGLFAGDHSHTHPFRQTYVYADRGELQRQESQRARGEEKARPVSCTL